MKTKNGFTLFDNVNEFTAWLKKQSVSRKITRLQVHHMASPDYNTWEKTDKKVYASDPELGRTNSLNSYGKNMGWGGIAQHFNIFPNGKITTGRSLNKTPVGIKGWNTNAICIEIYGNFDKGKDTMTAAQKKTVIAVYGELCKRFDITPSASTIRYHAWFTSGGTYLGDYSSSKSRKTCPGTNFFGGNTMAKFKANFLPLVKDYVNGKTTSTTSSSSTTTTSAYKTGIYRVIVDSLNIRKGAGTSYSVVGTVKKGDAYTIDKVSGSWGHLKSGAGWICISASYCEFVK